MKGNKIEHVKKKINDKQRKVGNLFRQEREQGDKYLCCIN